MSWLQKLLPPRIKATPGMKKTAVPEGLWIKCVACETVLYRTDLENNLYVCPKCAHHSRVRARERFDQLLVDRRVAALEFGMPHERRLKSCLMVQYSD